MNPGLIALLIGLAAGSIPSWWLTADHYQGAIARAEVARWNAIFEEQEKSRAGLLAYANRIIQAGAEDEKNTRTITDLRRTLDRVRINFPVCPVPEGGAAATGADHDRSAGVFSNGVDAAFAELQKATGRLVERADELNLDAIRRNAEGCPQ